MSTIKVLSLAPSEALPESRTVTPTFVPGALPHDPHVIVDLPAVAAVRRTVQVSLTFKSFGLVIGPPGLSKTTSTALAVRNCGLTPKYTIMSGGASQSPRAAIAAIYESLTGTEANTKATQLIRDVANILLTDRFVLVVDEANYISVAGLRTIVSVWNAVHTTRGHGTPIVLVGNNKSPISKNVPELMSRVRSRCTVSPLSKTEARAALGSLYPRFAVTPPGVTDMASWPFKGRIRDLAALGDMLRLFGPDAADADPVTEQEVVNAHATIGVHVGAGSV